MEFIIYLLKVNIALALFYGIYRLLFRQDTFFQWKRLTLLAVVFISFLYPAIDLSWQLMVNQPVKNILETVYIPVYHLPEVIISQNTTATVRLFPQMVLIIYFTISCLLLIRLLFQIGAIGYKLFHTKKIRLQGQMVHESQGLKTPFSFFRWIVLDSSLYSETELQEILLHEAAHVEQKHSIDTLLAETMCIVCWFNPFAWLLKTEIRMNLEFLADRSVLNSGFGAEHYQFHLLRLSYHKAAAKITNNFNVSLLKKRIFMMNKKQTPHQSIWKYALMLPVVAILLLFNYACNNAKAEKGNEEKSIQQEELATEVQAILSEPENTMDVVQPTPATTASTRTVNRIEDTPVLLDNDAPQNTVTNKEQVYSHVEQPPEFPGGMEALTKWLQENLVYPKEAAEQGIQGRVSLRFVIAPDGSVENITITKSLDPLCDREAVRAAEKMPKWIPGKQNGKPVSVYFNIPVMFRLSQNGRTSQPDSDTKVSDMYNKPNTIIEIDGKVVSNEEWEKFDHTTIKTMSLEGNNPKRIKIETKKD